MLTRSNKKLFLINLLLGFTTFLFSAPNNQRADFLIIENPGAFRIYNKYEQQITNLEYDLFKPFCALRLENTNITLSDNFTPADKIKLLGEYFYLLKNNSQDLNINQPAGYLKEFRNVLVIGDTVIISDNKRVYLQPPAGTQKIRLPAGTRVERIFESKNLTYIRTLDEAVLYGWVNLSDKSKWHRDDRKSAGPNLAQALERILPVFNRYNTLYQQLYRYFNLQTGEKHAIPRWELEQKDRRINAVLLNISTSDQLNNSFPYLLNELHQRLINTGLQLIVMDKRIEIK